MDEHFGCHEYERSDNPDDRNDKKKIIPLIIGTQVFQ